MMDKFQQLEDILRGVDWLGSGSSQESADEEMNAALDILTSLRKEFDTNYVMTPVARAKQLIYLYTMTQAHLIQQMVVMGAWPETIYEQIIPDKQYINSIIQSVRNQYKTV